MITDAQKMDILVKMEIPGFVKIDDKKAIARHNGNEIVFSSFNSNLWGAKIKGKTYKWDSEEVPEDFRDYISKIAMKYNEAVLEASENVEELDKEVGETLTENGFDLSNATITEENQEEKGISDAEKLKADLEKLEALERGEIEKPVKKTDWKKAPTTMVKRSAEQEIVEKITGRQVIPIDVRGMQIADLTVEEIRNYINPLATIQEAGMFVKLCQARGLNPFLGEAHLIKYSPNETAQFVTGKDAFTRRAEVNPHIIGWKAGIIVRLKGDNEHPPGQIERRQGSFKLPEEELLGGWAEAHRDDSIFPFVYEVTLEEYIQKKKDGNITKMWREKPCTMIRKDAIVGVLREGAPSELGGLYDAAEMGADAIEAVYSVVE